MNPEHFTQIKSKIETSTILSPQERTEWLYLLPRMSEQELKELDRILSIKMPESASTTSPGLRPPSPSPGEGNKVDAIDHPQRRLFTHLTQHKDGKLDKKESDLSLNPSPRLEREVKTIQPPTSNLTPPVIRRPEYAAVKAPEIPALSSLSRLTREALRKPPSVYVCLESIHKEIENMLAKTDITLHQVLEAIDSSPLNRDYLQTGLKFINREDKDAALTRDEFEALTDFRASLKKL